MAAQRTMLSSEELSARGSVTLPRCQGKANTNRAAESLLYFVQPVIGFGHAKYNLSIINSEATSAYTGSLGACNKDTQRFPHKKKKGNIAKFFFVISYREMVV